MKTGYLITLWGLGNIFLFYYHDLYNIFSTPAWRNRFINDNFLILLFIDGLSLILMYCVAQWLRKNI